MKCFSLLTLALALSVLSVSTSEAQIKKWYSTTGGEFIFSFANVDIAEGAGYPGIGSDGSKMRFSAVFHLQNWANYNFSDKAGFFTGIAIRNVGFISENGGEKRKFRTYNLGLPIGFKIGKMNRAFVYGGYELELPFHYKEKRFVDGDKKSKNGVWFSDRTAPIFHSVFAGYQFKDGVNLKFKYYLTEFFNQSYTENVGGQTVRPFEGVQANIFYVSLSFSLFHNTKFYYNSEHHRIRE